MREILLVATGGAIGAVARYLVSSWVHIRFNATLPYGTLVVNVAGCFLIGLLVQLAYLGPLFPTAARVMMITGLLGAFTTFSTFGYETVCCYQENGPTVALLNVFGNLVLGILAVLLGLSLGRWLVAVL